MIIKLFAAILLASMMLYGMALFGIGTAIAVGALIYFSPSFRSWWCSRRLFQRRLSKLPGMSSSSHGSMACVTFIYVIVLSLVAWCFVGWVIADKGVTTSFGSTLTQGAVGIILAVILLLIAGELNTEFPSPQSAMQPDIVVDERAASQAPEGNPTQAAPASPSVALTPLKQFPMLAILADISASPRAAALIVGAAVTPLLIVALFLASRPVRQNVALAPEGRVAMPAPSDTIPAPSDTVTPASIPTSTAISKVVPEISSTERSASVLPTDSPEPAPATEPPSSCITPDQKYVDEVLGGAIQAGIELMRVRVMTVESPFGSGDQWFLIGGELVESEDGGHVGYAVWINEIDPSGQSGYSGFMYSAEGFAESFSVYPGLASEFRPNPSDLREIVECVK